MHEEEDTYTGIGVAIEEQPSSSVVGEVITQVEGTLVALQDFLKKNQCMQMFPLSVISAHHMEGCGDMPLHDLGSRHTTDLEHMLSLCRGPLTGSRRRCKFILVCHCFAAHNSWGWSVYFWRIG